MSRDSCGCHKQRCGTVPNGGQRHCTHIIIRRTPPTVNCLDPQSREHAKARTPWLGRRSRRLAVLPSATVQELCGLGPSLDSTAGEGPTEESLPDVGTPTLSPPSPNASAPSPSFMTEPPNARAASQTSKCDPLQANAKFSQNQKPCPTCHNT